MSPFKWYLNPRQVCQVDLVNHWPYLTLSGQSLEWQEWTHQAHSTNCWLCQGLEKLRSWKTMDRLAELTLLTTDSAKILKCVVDPATRQGLERLTLVSLNWLHHLRVVIIKLTRALHKKTKVQPFTAHNSQPECDLRYHQISCPYQSSLIPSSQTRWQPKAPTNQLTPVAQSHSWQPITLGFLFIPFLCPRFRVIFSQYSFKSPSIIPDLNRLRCSLNITLFYLCA